jgi:hypothetical protein
MRKKLLLALGGICFALLVGEITARIILPLLPDPPNTPFIGDDDCMYRLRPSEPGRYPENHDDHVNTWGFRDRNHPRIKPEGRLRVLGLGDSFVYGAVSVRDNFLRVTERTWNDAGGIPLDILLMGVPGWSTENQLGYLNSEGLDLKPDLVLVNFFVENDVTGLPVRTRIIRGHAYPTTSPLPVRNLLRKSRLFVMFESLVWRGMVKGNRTEGAADPAPAGASVSGAYLKIVERNLPVYLREPDGRTAELWDQAIGYLEEVDAVCAAAGVPWLLVLIPGEIQVDPDVRAQVLKGLAANPDDYDFESPQRRLLEWADDGHHKILDLLPTLRREHQAQDRLYVPNDTHWNERGNAVAGETIFFSLLDQFDVMNPER